MRGFYFCIRILVKGSKQHHGNIRIYFLTPAIIFYHDVVRDIHQVMERYLESLLEREQFTFIRTGVVTLTLARRSAYQIRMDVVAVTGDIAGFLDILAPVASLLPGLDDIDSYHLHFPSIRINVITGNPYLPGVLDTGNEVLDILLFLFDAFQLLQRVRDMLFSTDVTPVILMYLDLVLYTGMIPELCLLALL